MGYTEPLRRFIQPEGYDPQVNEIQNQMRSWMSGQDYLVNFRKGILYQGGRGLCPAAWRRLRSIASSTRLGTAPPPQNKTPRACAGEESPATPLPLAGTLTCSGSMGRAASTPSIWIETRDSGPAAGLHSGVTCSAASRVPGREVSGGLFTLRKGLFSGSENKWKKDQMHSLSLGRVFAIKSRYMACSDQSIGAYLPINHFCGYFSAGPV